MSDIHERPILLRATVASSRPDLWPDPSDVAAGITDAMGKAWFDPDDGDDHWLTGPLVAITPNESPLTDKDELIRQMAALEADARIDEGMESELDVLRNLRARVEEYLSHLSAEENESVPSHDLPGSGYPVYQFTKRLNPDDVDVQDSGMAKIIEVGDDEDQGLFVRIQSWSEELTSAPPNPDKAKRFAHPDFDSLIGKVVVVTVEGMQP